MPDEQDDDTNDVEGEEDCWWVNEIFPETLRLPPLSDIDLGSDPEDIPWIQEDWTWNEEDRSEEVKLKGPGSRVAQFHPSWSSGTAAVRGTKPLNNGRHYWEIRLSHRVFGTSMMFGVGTKKARLHVNKFVNLVGEDSHSWGLSHKGLLFHGGQRVPYASPFQENKSTTIGMLFDGICGSLSYFKDGVSLGIAFMGLESIKEPIYPIISSTAAKTEIALVCAQRDLVSLQERCRAAVITSFKSQSDVKNLSTQLPPLLQNYLLAHFTSSPIFPNVLPIPHHLTHPHFPSFLCDHQTCANDLLAYDCYDYSVLDY